MVVDTCIDEDELNAFKETLIFSLPLIQDSARIGLITFGKSVQVFLFKSLFQFVFYKILIND